MTLRINNFESSVNYLIFLQLHLNFLRQHCKVKVEVSRPSYSSVLISLISLRRVEGSGR